MLDDWWPLVHPESADFPVELRLTQHYRLPGELPGGFHRGNVEIGVALYRLVFLRPQVIEHALVSKSGGIKTEGVDAAVHLPHEFPRPLQRVSVFVANGIHPVLEQLVFDLSAGRSGEIDVPG